MIKKSNVKKLLFTLIPMLIISSACSSKIDKRVEETEKENKEIQKEIDIDVAPEDVELSEESLEALEEIDKITPEEALGENELDAREEIKVNPVNEKNVYENVEEFSQFIANMFFMYHSNGIDGEEFFNTISPHFHEEFKTLLPSETSQQIETFEVLQEMFIKSLPAAISNYKLTNVKFSDRQTEGNFYRVYELENGENVYYETLIKKEGEQWLLLDDSPAPPYEILPNIENEFNTESSD